jgi:hypothetical protein
VFKYEKKKQKLKRTSGFFKRKKKEKEDGREEDKSSFKPKTENRGYVLAFAPVLPPLFFV